MHSSRLEVEASTAFAGNNFLFFLPVYVGPFDVRVWTQRSKSDGFGVEELFHISVFEDGRLVNLAEDSRFHFGHSVGDEGEIIFSKRSDAEGYLQSLYSTCHHDYCDDEDNSVSLTPDTEAQTKYWSLVGPADDVTELGHWHGHNFPDPMEKVYW